MKIIPVGKMIHKKVNGQCDKASYGQSETNSKSLTLKIIIINLEIL